MVATPIIAPQHVGEANSEEIGIANFLFRRVNRTDEPVGALQSRLDTPSLGRVEHVLDDARGLLQRDHGAGGVQRFAAVLKVELARQGVIEGNRMALEQGVERKPGFETEGEALEGRSLECGSRAIGEEAQAPAKHPRIGEPDAEDRIAAQGQAGHFGEQSGVGERVGIGITELAAIGIRAAAGGFGGAVYEGD